MRRSWLQLVACVLRFPPDDQIATASAAALTPPARASGADRRGAGWAELDAVEGHEAESAGEEHDRSGRDEWESDPELVEHPAAPEWSDNARQAAQRLGHAERAALVPWIGEL